MERKLSAEGKVVREVLTNLKKPNRLANNKWLSSCLVSQRHQEKPQLTKEAALTEVFMEILEVIKVESPPYFDILHKRYWLGLQMKEILASGGEYATSERNLNYYLIDAINRFTVILQGREDECQKNSQVIQHSEVEEIAASHSPTRLFSGAPRLLLLLILAPLFAVVLFVFNQSAVMESCEDVTQVSAEVAGLGQFVRAYGVTSFAASNTKDAVLHNRVRALAVDGRGLWFGYFPAVRGLPTSVSFYNKESWEGCKQEKATAGKNVNALAVDRHRRVWVATEETGIGMFDGSGYHEYTTKDGLPNDKTYGLAVDAEDNVWVGTWDGVARFDNGRWSVPYSPPDAGPDTNHVHALTFDSAGNMWIGYISDGVRVYNKAEGQWTHYTTMTSGIGGNAVRSIIAVKSTSSSSDAIWIATADGGVSKFEQGKWTTYNISNGLPSNDARVVVVDKHNRIWVGTAQGTVYFNGQSWILYHSFETLSIAFGPSCTRCPFDDDNVWTGTANMGLTHSRVPYPTPAIEIVSVTYPKVVAPGQTFCPEVVVRPLPPYQLQKGDFLSNTNQSDENLFGAYPLIEVTRPVPSGQTFTFKNCKSPFIAPNIDDNRQGEYFSSTWMLWMNTRYVGEKIIINFYVDKNIR